MLNQDHIQNSHHYRTEIPNIILDIGLDYKEIAVYTLIKKIAGDSGVCFMAKDKICKILGMNPRTYSLTEKSLEKVNPYLGFPLIEIERSSGRSDRIVVYDIWDINYSFNIEKRNTKGVKPPAKMHPLQKCTPCKNTGGTPCKNTGGPPAKMHPEEEQYNNNQKKKQQQTEKEDTSKIQPINSAAVFSSSKKEVSHESYKRPKSESEKNAIAEYLNKTTSDNIGYSYKSKANETKFSLKEQIVNNSESVSVTKKKALDKIEERHSPLSYSDIQIYINKYSLEELEYAVDWINSQKISRNNTGGALANAIQNRYPVLVSPEKKKEDEKLRRENTVKTNKEWALNIRNSLGSGDLYFAVTDTSVQYREEKGYGSIGFAENGFKDQIESYLRKKGKWQSEYK